MKFKLKDLRQLPKRPRGQSSAYSSIMVIPSGRKHDSGWALMYIVGLDDDKNPVEIAADCDDIIWITPCNPYNSLRTDMKYPSGIIHFWLKDHVFKIGASLSSTTIFVTPQNEK